MQPSHRRAQTGLPFHIKSITLSSLYALLEIRIHRGLTTESGCPLRSSDQALRRQRYIDQDSGHLLNQVLTRDADKVETMLGSYSADPKPRNTEVISDNFPSGLVARGEYKVVSKVVDLDGTVWLGASILLIARILYQNNR